MGWNEWPLMVFTVFGQIAVGAYWLCAYALFTTEGGGTAAAERLERLMVAVLAVAGLGFAISSLHIGSPWRGINVFIRVGQAPLSNEVLFGMAFLAAAGFAWLLTFRAGTVRLRRGLYGLALALSVAFLWNMTAFYLMPTVPTWDTPLTPAAFLVTAAVGGALLAGLLFGLAGIASPRLARVVAAVAAVGLAAAVVVAAMLFATLSGIRTPAHDALALSPDIGALQAVRFVLLFLAVGLVLRQVGRSPAAVVPTTALALVLALCGEFIGRGVFYALHMTVGVV